MVQNVDWSEFHRRGVVDVAVADIECVVAGMAVKLDPFPASNVPVNLVELVVAVARAYAQGVDRTC